jgi:hypothetical protein
LANASTIEHPSVTTTATEILDKIRSLQNAEITEVSAHEFVTSIRTLANQCNERFLKNIQMDGIYIPSNTIQTEIKSWYFSDLNFTNIQKYIIDTFENLERNSYSPEIESSNRCIDALYVLVDYLNVVIFSRLAHRIKLRQKNLDDCSSSSNSVETSAHLV